MGPKTVQNGIFQKRTLWDHTGPFGPVLTRFQSFWPILASFLPGLENVAESNMGPKPVQNDFFQKWPPTLWEGQTDLCGPVWARFDQFYGHTGYRILDTGHRPKGGWEDGRDVFQYA